MPELKDRVAVVTGGGSGIGQATALAFAKAGAKVVIAGRNVENGKQTVALIEALPGAEPDQAIFVQTDVTKADQVEALIAETVKHYGRLDYAFNNAGFGHPPRPTADLSEDEWDTTINSNLKSVWLSMKYEIAQMLQQKQSGITDTSVIINNASVAGHVGTPGLSAYTASKHAMIGLTKTAALEYARAGIRVNAVSPGAIITPGIIGAVGSVEAFESFMLPLHPIGRLGQPDEVAQAVVWLCSDGASFITGAALSIDGGATAQ